MKCYYLLLLLFHKSNILDIKQIESTWISNKNLNKFYFMKKKVNYTDLILL